MWKFPDRLLFLIATIALIFYRLFAPEISRALGNGNREIDIPYLLVFWFGYRFILMADYTDAIEKGVKIAAFGRVAGLYDAFVIVNESIGAHALGKVTPIDPVNVQGTDAYKLGLLFTSSKEVSVLLKDQTFHSIDLSPYKIEKGCIVRFRSFDKEHPNQMVGSFYGIDRVAGLEIIIEP